MSGWEVPRNLLRAVESGDPDSVQRRWLASLPGIVAGLAREWSLAEVARPFQPGGTTAWVAEARTGGGEPVVLKVGWRHEEALHEADGLRVWDGEGAVRLLDARVFGHTSALLVEACRPGTPLSVLPEAEQDGIVAKLLPRLWISPPKAHPFRTLQSMCDSWAEEFDERLEATRGCAGALDAGIVRAGIDLLRELPSTAVRQVVLCTDLHAGNILAAEREPWLIVDPKPYVGDPTFDVLQHLLNCDRLTSQPAAFLRRMAHLLDLDPGRLRAWTFARCVHESLEQPHLRSVAITLAP